ncbi:PadR family transcriptional regulator [Blastococcus tunisiensis]|uniref:DNA-binding transcriptional regulator, PadR family n=1 Tax=Blastococcus tunisiensis TaxID=1798228 RepID=A0A1I2I3Q6_9ACTN|nr:PadR family transcriptional regulator [Blastococcus sp. DSM 46838]SFF35717.1 DNA-binding transcriptional regulator, PadR family [Blastococcus sp. DSM 46838]
MVNERLSPTSYVVLGMVALRGPSTSYDLKRAIQRSIGYFWPFPHAGLYSEPQRLEKLGLLSADSEQDGRRRRTYSITDAGLREVRAWLAAPTNEHFQLRDVAELKLFFNELGEPTNVRRLAREQIEQHEQRIRVYEDMQERYGGVPSVARRMVTLRLGLEMERAALRFWTALSEEESAGGGDEVHGAPSGIRADMDSDR